MPPFEFNAINTSYAQLILTIKFLYSIDVLPILEVLEFHFQLGISPLFIKLNLKCQFVIMIVPTGKKIYWIGNG